MNFKCPCGETVVYPTEGRAYHVGDAIAKTKWTYGTCSFTGNAVWLCPECAEKAKKLAKELFELVGTPYYHWTSLLNRDEVNEWCNNSWR